MKKYKQVRLKIMTKDCRLVVRVKISLGEKISGKELDLFARTYLRGFLKPKLIKKNLIEYTGPIGISLQERLRKPISKRDFLFIVEQTVVAVQKLQANGLLAERMLLDLQNVFINEVTKEVQFIYLPLASNDNKGDLLELMESLIYSALPIQEEDSECISRFVYFIKNLDGFQTEKIEEFILREDKSIVNTIKKQNAGQSGFMTSKQQRYYEHYAEKQEIEEATALLLGAEEEEATALLIEEEATALLTEDDEQTSLLVEEHYPSFLRVLTGEEIFINKPVFRFGKEKNHADYCVVDNHAVSRRHADIITRGQNYFVKDLDSRNHTYINNQLLTPQCEVEIRDGDILKLGNEEFIFIL